MNLGEWSLTFLADCTVSSRRRLEVSGYFSLADEFPERKKSFLCINFYIFLELKQTPSPDMI